MFFKTKTVHLDLFLVQSLNKTLPSFLLSCTHDLLKLLRIYKAKTLKNNNKEIVSIFMLQEL